jgi:hypothetical protein
VRKGVGGHVEIGRGMNQGRSRSEGWAMRELGRRRETKSVAAPSTGRINRSLSRFSRPLAAVLGWRRSGLGQDGDWWPWWCGAGR